MSNSQTQTVRPDSKGRISLGTFSKGVSGYRVHKEKDGRLILEPLAEIPARELWLFQKKVALKQVQKGLHDASKGNVSKRKSFSQYIDEELD